ncbi:hypothetical protein M405DRAFT_833791 [Rhizopogon salebrosus TDB-379]|nr:hypothetical protein M405DRAFT_833791 [Rhizopogon salebrosus TDB-379]
MPVLASSAFLEMQAVISFLPPSQHNFSKNPPGPLPPPPSTRGVRPRSGSFDDPAYLVARTQPFSKTTVQ